MWIYILSLLTSFLGLLVGILISNMAVEEIEHAEKYMRYSSIILVPIIVLVAIYGINQTYAIIASIVLLGSLYALRKRYTDTWIYASMGGVFYLSTISNQALTTGTIIFFYGMCIATVNASRHFKKKINGKIKFSENVTLLKKLLKQYSYYLVVGLLFYALFSYAV